MFKIAAAVFCLGALCAAASAEVTVRPGHPRLMLTDADIARAAANIEANTRTWQILKTRIDNGTADVPTYGLAYLATGDEEIGRAGVERLMQSNNVEQISIGYDWLNDLLDQEQKQALFERISPLAERDAAARMNAPWTNFVQRATYRAAVAGAAFGADFPEARTWIQTAYEQWRDFHLPAALISGDGGSWPEGTIYSYIVYGFLTRLADVFWTSTDIDIYGDTPWFADRLGWWRFHAWPMPKDFAGRPFYMYHPNGDSERWRAPMQNQELAAQLRVMRYLGDTDQVRKWRWFMDQLDGPIASEGQWELLAYWDENAPQQKPTSLSWVCDGTGLVFIRSSWEPSATWITYQAGPRFTYHQHADQGAFGIFKQGDLTSRGGVYEPHGPTEQDGHLVAYASRVSAYNTVTIYNPTETYRGYRSGNVPRNDGGQRHWLPYSNTAGSAEYWQRGFDEGAYDTGHIVEFEDAGDYVYIASDLTGAYNSSAYVSGDNISKTDEVTRQLVYLRPEDEGDIDALVIFDRVVTTDPSFETRILFQMTNESYVAGEETKIDDSEYHYDGDLAQTDVGGGRLFMRFLYPEEKKIIKLTPPDKQYWVTGRNYPVPDTPWESGYGHGRLEVLSTEETTDHFFLTVLFPSDKSVKTAPAVSRSDGETMSVVIFGENGREAMVSFDKSDSLGGVLSTEHDAPQLARPFGSGGPTVHAFDTAPRITTSLHAPSIQDLAVSEVTTRVTVSWQSDEPTDGYVEFGPDMEMRYLIDSPNERALEHSVTLDGLDPGQTYYVRAAATGASPVTGFSEMIRLDVPADAADAVDEPPADHMVNIADGPPRVRTKRLTVEGLVKE